MIGAQPRGAALLHDPARNKDTVFTEAERDAFGLRGLLPPRALTQEQQLARSLENLPGAEELERHLARFPEPDDLESFVRAPMYRPHCESHAS